LGEHLDAIVIGGGILGAATAYELSKAGKKTVVLEKGAPNREGSGTTAGNLHIQAIHTRRPGQLVAADNARFLPLQREASKRWSFIEDELETSVELRRSGGFMVAENEIQVKELRAKHELEKRNGLASHFLSGDEARVALPLLSRAVTAAVFCPEDGYANPLKVVPAYLRAAQRLGTRVHGFTTVDRISADGGVYRVSAANAEWLAPTVINVTGPWIADVAGLLGIDLDMSPVAIQMQATVRVPPLMHHLVEHIGEGLSVKQVSAGNILIGGGWPGATLDLSGRSAISLRSMFGNLELAQRILPFLTSMRILRAWAGPLAATPDELPVVGEVPGFPGFFVGGGTYAFTLAPLWAEVLRDLAIGVPPAVDLSGLGPERLMKGTEEGPPSRTQPKAWLDATQLA
jgi:sarcosine oxidase subunit beta